MSQNVSEIEAEISSLDDVKIEEMQFWYFERQHNKTTKLASRYEAIEPIEGKHRWFDYSFKESVFLSHVVVKLDGYHPTDQFEFKFREKDGNTGYGYVRPEESQITIEVAKFCTDFSFRPPRTWLRSTHVNKVMVFGFREVDTEHFIEFVRNIDNLKSRAISEIEAATADANDRLDLLRQKESQRDQLNSEIADAEAKLSSVRSEIASQSAELSELLAKVGAKETQLDNLNEQEDRVRSEVNSLTEKRNSQNQEVDNLNNRLSQLRDEIDIFPSEIAGFVSQAGRDITTYNRYTMVLVAIIVAMLVWVLAGSFDLSEFIKRNANRDVWQLIAAKIPLSLVAAALVTASYKLARVFVQEQISINRQKLSLTQISIIAKDISQASEHNLELSKEEIYSARLKIKMALLSDHIKTFVKSDPTDVLPQRLFGLTRRRVPERDDSETEGEDSQE